MDHALPADKLSFQAGALWAWLLDAAESVRRSLRGRRTLSPAQQRLYSIAESLGAYVLDAEDVTDLRARLYALGRSQELMEWELAVFRELSAEDLSASTEAEPAIAAAFGDTHLARDCARLLAARMSAIAQVLERAEPIELPDDAARGIGLALADFRTPELVRSLFDETLAGEASLVALLAPLMDPDRWSCAPWMRLALLEQVRLASVSHLRLLSVVPNVNIPDDVLPADERLDPQALAAESQELSRYVLPAALPVGRDYADALLEEVEGSAPPPAGIRALFPE